MMAQVAAIEASPTAGEWGALLIENAAIKAEQPLYNKRQRRRRKLFTCYFEANADGFLQPIVRDFHSHTAIEQTSYGLFGKPQQLQERLREQAREHGFCLRVMGVDKGKGACFQHQLGRCRGACIGKESAQAHNQRLLQQWQHHAIAAWPFAGPVLLEEQAQTPLPGQPAKQWHAVHHWSYLGSGQCPKQLAKQLAAPLATAPLAFDRDVYRILWHALADSHLTLTDINGNRLTAASRRSGSNDQTEAGDSREFGPEFLIIHGLG
jgi:hypothetical protein